MNSRVRGFITLHGIHHHLSRLYTPQQNGRAERKHRHISEIGFSMMFHAHAPASLWFDAFGTVVYVINMLPPSLLHDKSPFELLFRLAPKYLNLNHLVIV